MPEPDHLSLDLWLKYRHDFDLIAAIEDAAQHAPETFADLIYRRDEYDLTLEDFSHYLSALWAVCGDTYLPRDVWRSLFDAAGYRVNDGPAERPTKPLVLWRGATPGVSGNWSWTPFYDVAHEYASGRWVQDEVGLVWRAVVEPARLLARISNDEHFEYIVDTDGLAIEPYALWCRCPVDLTPFRGEDREAQFALDMHELVTCIRSRPPHDLQPVR